MVDVQFGDERIPLAPGQTVLDALLDHGHGIPNGCRAGACQSCLMQAVEGSVPPAAQAGLKDTLKAQGYFLACRCEPATSLRIELAEAAAVRTVATLVERDLLAGDILRLRLLPETPFDYRAGQYVTLWHPEGIGRSYSLASVPGCDAYLELHVRRIAGGRVSPWLHDHVKVGDSLALQGPAGDCFYLPGQPEQGLLLAGAGTGLAPLIGIARDALAQGHRGKIHLFHGAVKADGLYLHDTLMALAEAHGNFHYHASVLEPADAPAEAVVGDLPSLVMSTVPAPADWRVYLCGAPDLVNMLKKQLFLAGTAMADIHSDPFLATPGP